MPITATFKVLEHPEHGGLGFAMCGRDWADPVGAQAVAHDMLEHLPNDRGSVEQEFMALGASLHVRCGDLYYRRQGSYYDAARNISAEYYYQWYYMVQNGRDTLYSPGRTTRLPDDIESVLASIDLQGTTTCELEYQDDQKRCGFCDPVERAKIVGWMRRGYRAAVRRFRPYSSYELLEAFIAAAQAVERALKFADEYQMYRVSIDIASCTTTVKEST